jgi:hypothetical protein
MHPTTPHAPRRIRSAVWVIVLVWVRALPAVGSRGSSVAPEATMAAGGGNWQHYAGNVLPADEARLRKGRISRKIPLAVRLGK